MYVAGRTRTLRVGVDEEEAELGKLTKVPDQLVLSASTRPRSALCEPLTGVSSWYRGMNGSATRRA